MNAEVPNQNRAAGWWSGAVLAVAVVAVYWNSLTTPFVFDDVRSIPGNETIRQLWPPGRALSPPAGEGLTVDGRPVLNFSLALNYAAGGTSVIGYHALNIAIHLGAALALFGVVRRTLERGVRVGRSEGRSLLAGDGARGESPASRLLPQDATMMALAVALLWAVHPLQTESVTYVIQRAESLMGLFFLLTFYFFGRGVDAAGEGVRRAWFAAAVLACLLGAGTKEVTAAAPLLVLLYDRAFVAGTFREAGRKRWGFYAGLALVWPLLAWLVVSTGSRGGTAGLVLDIDSRGWSDYQSAAEEVAQLVASHPATLGKLYPGTDGAGFIASVGRRLFRRPLTQQEVARLQSIFELGAASAGDSNSFAMGAEAVLEALLQSPHFLYRTELGAPGTLLNGYELAAKLSLWLRDTSPDLALLDAAESGALDTAQGVATIASKLLDEPVALQVMRQFHGQLLHLSRFSELSKVGVQDYDPEINAELMEAAYLFFDKIFTQGGGLTDVFLSTSGFVGPRMASAYGMPRTGSALTERELGTGRVGFFTQLPYLMLYAHNDEPDAIHRGVTLALDVLCAPLGPPAAMIPPLPTRKPGQTNRMRVDEHTSVCGGACHNDLINPLGFAFENFDGMGRYRVSETNGNETLPIDASGSFKFVDGMQSWHNAGELMQVLAREQQTHLCYAKKLASFGLQRDIVESDMPLLQQLAAASQAGPLKQLIVTLLQTDAFRTRSGGMP